jgi:23S rRNA (adenine-N6)-dimethyltransferase
MHQRDPRWAARLVPEAYVPPGALVIDVGAGRGVLTPDFDTELLIRGGARVTAVEAHPGRVRFLREQFGDAIVVVQADAADLRLPRPPFHVVANPPFAVTSALRRRLLQPGSRLLRARLVLDRRAPRRWAGPEAPGIARWGVVFEASVARGFPRRAFRRPPHVDCAVLAIRRRQ